jgi:hypothetical protein
LCHQLFGQRPETYLIGISGVDFELGHGMSPDAAQYLEGALDYFLEKIASEIRLSV